MVVLDRRSLPAALYSGLVASNELQVRLHRDTQIFKDPHVIISPIMSEGSQGSKDGDTTLETETKKNSFLPIPSGYEVVEAAGLSDRKHANILIKDFTLQNLTSGNSEAIYA